MPDEQLQQFAKNNGIDLTKEEIRRLRKIMKHANISWAIAGVPKETLKKVHKLLGDGRFKKLMKLAGL